VKVNTDNLKGKCAFVSGATGGIGKAIAVTLAKEGCDLFLTSTTDSSLQLIVDICKEHDVRVKACSGDLSNEKDIYNIINCAKENFKGIDILINSAGVFPNENLFAIDDKSYSKVMDINFRSAFIFTREFSKYMSKEEWGRIVNIGSSSAYSGFGGTSLYCATKHALLGFSRAIHDELKRFNVRSYYISPSSTQSKMGMATKGQDYETFLHPSDIAKYVVFSISFDSNIMSEEIFLKRMIIR
jgi:3-oxoacyl-[acyl-carrier protein] reductase